jgi:hypothetical protein
MEILITHGEKQFNEELLFLLLQIIMSHGYSSYKKVTWFSLGERKKKEEGGS